MHLFGQMTQGEIKSATTSFSSTKSFLFAHFIVRENREVVVKEDLLCGSLFSVENAIIVPPYSGKSG